MPRRPLEEPKNRAAQIVSDFWPNLETSADWHAEGGGGSGGSHVVAVEVSCRIFFVKVSFYGSRLTLIPKLDSSA